MFRWFKQRVHTSHITVPESQEKHAADQADDSRASVQPSLLGLSGSDEQIHAHHAFTQHAHDHDTLQEDDQLMGKKRVIVFVDYENIQHIMLDPTPDITYTIVIFTGEQQAKIRTQTMAHILASATSTKIIQVIGTSPNNLDFHICAEVGIWHTQEPLATIFAIFSHDTGFDHLIRYFGTYKQRTILRMPAVSSSSSKPALSKKSHLSPIPLIEKYDSSHESIATHAIRYYEQRLLTKQGRPCTVAALKNDIKSFFTHHLSSKESATIYPWLLEAALVTLQADKKTIAYPISIPYKIMTALKQSTNRPKTVKGLKNMIRSHIRGQHPEEDIEKVYAYLHHRNMFSHGEDDILQYHV